MKKLLAKKKDNKGFSLVELIVVILIMAVIAVALAPQVMKWVGKSKTSTDTNNIGQIESAVNAGVADYMAKKNTATVPACQYQVAGNLTFVTGSGTEDADLTACIKEAMNDKYPTVQQASGKHFLIAITSTGKVTVSIPDLTPIPD